MKRRKLWTFLAAWMLALSMIFADSSMIALAQDESEAWEDSGEVTDVDEKMEASEGPLENEAAVSESAEEIPDENVTDPQEQADAAGETEKEEVQPEQEDTLADDSSAGKKTLSSAAGEGQEKAAGDEEELNGLRFECTDYDTQIPGWYEEYHYLDIYEKQSAVIKVYDGETLCQNIEWKILEEQDDPESAKEVKDAASITQKEDEAGSYILSVQPIKGVEDKDYVLRASMTENGQEAVNYLHFHVMKEEYNYFYPFGGIGENQMLPGGSLWIDKNMGCWVRNQNHVDGGEVLAEITEVEITDGGEFVVCEKNEEDTGWNLQGIKSGEAKVKITYTPAEGDDNEGIYIKDIIVAEDIYELNWSYPESTDQMLPGSKMQLKDITMGHRFLMQDENNPEDQWEEWEEIKDFKLKLADAGNGIVSVNVNSAEKSVTLTANQLENWEGASDTIIHIYSEADGQRADAKIYVNVTDLYYNLLPLSAVDSTLALGDTIDLNEIPWQLKLYDDKNRNGKDVTAEIGTSYRLECGGYDENAWKETKAAADGRPLPTLMRTGNWGTGITVLLKDIREERDEELCRRDLQFDDLGNMDFRFTYEGFKEGEAENKLFEGTPLNLEIIQGNASVKNPDGYTVEWNIEQYNHETQLDDVYVEIEKSGLSAKFTTNLPENYNQDEDHYWIFVKAVVSYEGNVISYLERDIELRKPYYDYQDPLAGPGNNQILLGGELSIGTKLNCWYEDPQAPFGMDQEAAIRNVSVKRQEIFNDEIGEWETSSAEILSCEGNAANGWKLKSTGEYGRVVIEITHDPVESDKINQDPVMETEVYIQHDIFRLNWDYPEDGYHMGTNSALTISGITMSHEYVDEEDGNQHKEETVKDFTLAVQNQDGLTYDDNMVKVKPSGKNVQITSFENTGGTGIYLIGMVTNEHGMPEECSGADIIVEIHRWSGWYVTKKASCEGKGSRTHRCTECGREESEEIAAAGHKWSSWTTKTAATALAKKTEIRKCSICKKTVQRSSGKKLKATIKVPSVLKMKAGQKTTAFKITGMAKGDYVKSVKSNKTGILKVTNVKKTGTCKLAAQKKTGKAVLEIKLASGLTKKVTVTVQKATVKTTKISGLPKTVRLKKGQKKTLVPVLTPVTSQQKITYKSSKPGVASVSSKGTVTAKKKGNTKITVTSGSKKYTVTVIIK